MYELPLFPLNTVLFPGTSLHLHIFEERYKRMVSLCLTTRQPFGVVLIRRGSEALGALTDPYTIGCSAQITQAQRLDAGRMNIAAVGLERFRVLALEKHAQPYLVGYVEPYPIDDPEPDAAQAACQALRNYVDRYLTMLSKAGASQIEVSQMPDEPAQFSYAAAAVLQMSALDKQSLLASETIFELATNLNRLYRREIALVKSMLTMGKETQGVFSPN